MNLAALFGVIAQPIIPDAAETIIKALTVAGGDRLMNFSASTDYAALLDRLPRGRLITPPPVLFAKIEDAQVAEWTARFGGG